MGNGGDSNVQNLDPPVGMGVQHKVLGIYNHIGTHGISIEKIWERMGIHDFLQANHGKSAMGNPQIMSIFTNIFSWLHIPNVQMGSAWIHNIWELTWGTLLHWKWWTNSDMEMETVVETVGELWENDGKWSYHRAWFIIELWIKHYHMSYLNSKWLFGGGGSFKHAWRWSRKGASWPWWARVTDTWYNIRVVFQPIVRYIYINWWSTRLNHIMMPILWSSN